MTQQEILALFDQYHNMAYRLSLSYTHSVQDAEDMVQTVFLKAMESKSIPEAGKEKAWLIQVTINACKDLLRSFRRKAGQYSLQTDFRRDRSRFRREGDAVGI